MDTAKTGKITYCHSAETPVLVAPGQPEVIALRPDFTGLRTPDPWNRRGPPGEGTGPTEPRHCCRPGPLTRRCWTHLVSSSVLDSCSRVRSSGSARRAGRSRRQMLAGSQRHPLSRRGRHPAGRRSLRPSADVSLRYLHGCHYFFVCKPESYATLYQWVNLLLPGSGLSAYQERLKVGRQWHTYTYR